MNRPQTNVLHEGDTIEIRVEGTDRIIVKIERAPTQFGHRDPFTPISEVILIATKEHGILPVAEGYLKYEVGR